MTNQLSNINSKISRVQELLNSDFLRMSDVLKNYSNKHISSSGIDFSCIDNVIIDLQYNDIISQKLTHIKHLNDRIMDDKSQSVCELHATSFGSISYEIMLVNIGQLDRIREELDDILSRMKKNVSGIEELICRTSEVSLNLQGIFTHSEEVFELVDALSMSIKKLMKDMDKSALAEKDKIRNILKVGEIYTVDSEREILKDVFNLGELETGREGSDVELF